jgi:hypothetical protein
MKQNKHFFLLFGIKTIVNTSKPFFQCVFSSKNAEKQQKVVQSSVGCFETNILNFQFKAKQTKTKSV